MKSDRCRQRLMGPVCLLFSLGQFLIHSPGDAQVQLAEMSPVREIQVRLLVRLGDQDGPGAIGRPVVVDQRKNGEWVVADAQNSEFVSFFTREGKWLRTLGRKGEGPGEFQRAWFLQVFAGDSLAVFDYANGRLTVFSPDLAIARMSTLRIPVTRMVLLPSGSMAVAAMVLTAESAGLPLHILSRDGQLLRSFGAEPPIRNASDTNETWRSIDGTARGTLWAAHLNRYVVEEWAEAGKRIRHFERSVPWFRPGGTFGRPRSGDGPPGPGIADLHEDEAGLLWVAVSVPDPKWKQAWVPGRDPYGQPRPVIEDRNLYWDTRLEVIDPRRGLVIASTVLDEYVLSFTESGGLVTYRFREGMIPTVDVLRAQLSNPEGRVTK